MNKAKKEMEEEYQHDLLGTQGRTLYQYVLIDNLKAKRLHSKLKARNKCKQKQVGNP